MTKLILTVVRDDIREDLLTALLDDGFRVTEFASTGGFLRRGNHTFMIGAESEQVEQVLDIIRQTCPTPSDADEHNATVFVLDAAQSLHL